MKLRTALQMFDARVTQSCTGSFTPILMSDHEWTTDIVKSTIFQGYCFRVNQQLIKAKGTHYQCQLQLFVSQTHSHPWVASISSANSSPYLIVKSWLTEAQISPSSIRIKVLSAEDVSDSSAMVEVNVFLSDCSRHSPVVPDHCEDEFVRTDGQVTMRTLAAWEVFQGHLKKTRIFLTTPQVASPP